MKEIVCQKDELSYGEMTSAQLGPIRLVVVRASDGSLHALAANCLHQGGPLDRGKLYEHVGATEDGGTYVADHDHEVLKCPWHGFEYDIHTGCTLFDENRCLQKFPVREEDEVVVVELDSY